MSTRRHSLCRACSDLPCQPFKRQECYSKDGEDVVDGYYWDYQPVESSYEKERCKRDRNNAEHYHTVYQETLKPFGR